MSAPCNPPCAPCGEGECWAEAGVIAPGSPAWLRLMTASKVAAVLGLSPWESPRSLWHRMHGDLPSNAETDATRRGHYLEPAVLAWWRDQHGVTDDREWKDQPTYTLDGWASATPDAACCHPVDDTVLVEAKSTAQEWDELPAYYLTQVIWQMHVSGIHRCYVPVIGPRLTFTEYVVDYADYVEDAKVIEARCREFYDSLAADTPPPLDDTVATYDAVRKVHKDIEQGAAIEIDRDLAVLIACQNHDHKALTDALRLSKSTVLDHMGRAQYATCNGIRIARRQRRGDNDVTFVVTAKPSDLIQETP